MAIVHVEKKKLLGSKDPARSASTAPLATAPILLRSRCWSPGLRPTVTARHYAPLDHLWPFVRLWAVRRWLASWCRYDKNYAAIRRSSQDEFFVGKGRTNSGIGTVVWDVWCGRCWWRRIKSTSSGLYHHAIMRESRAPTFYVCRNNNEV